MDIPYTRSATASNFVRDPSFPYLQATEDVTTDEMQSEDIQHNPWNRFWVGSKLMVMIKRERED